MGLLKLVTLDSQKMFNMNSYYRQWSNTEAVKLPVKLPMEEIFTYSLCIEPIDFDINRYPSSTFI